MSSKKRITSGGSSEPGSRPKESPGSTAALLEELRACGISMELQGQDLRVRGKTSAITPALREEIAKRKVEILEFLQSHNGRRDHIELVDRAAPIPLGLAQEPILLVEHLAPRGGAYNIMLALRVRGALELSALRAAQDALVARHEALRTTFEERRDGFVQTLHASMEVELPLVELGEGSSDLERAIQEVVQTPFDLSHGPLLRSTLFKLSEADHILVLVVHHAVADGWSLGILRRELFELYAARVTGRASSLPPLAIQYADFAAWQRAEVTGGALAASLDYWRGRLKGIKGLIDLPLDRRRPARPSYRGGLVPVSIPPATARRFVEMCSRERASLFMGALSAFEIVLHRYTGEEDLVIGTPMAMRTRRAAETLVGNTINTIVLRTSVTGSLTGREVIARTRATALAAFDHADVPFERIVRDLSPLRDQSHNPVYQVMFNVDTPKEVIESAGLVVSTHHVDPGRSQLDLTLTLYEEGDAIQGDLTYNSDIFDRETAAMVARHFERVVAELVRDADRAVSVLPLLSEEERRELLAGAAERPERSAAPGGINELFQRQARRRPDAVALSLDGESLTYGELETRVLRLAGHLRSLGVGRDVLVPILAERSVEMIVGILAVLEAGGAYVPVDSGYPASRVSFILEDCGGSILLTQEALLPRVKDATMRIVRLDGDEWQAAPATRTDSRVEPDDLAYVIYTSGSTGKPKGALVTHRNVTRLFSATEHWFHFGPDDVWTLFHSFAFDFSVWEIFGALTRGGRLAIVPYDVSRAPERFYELLAREGVTVLNQTPSAFRQLMAAEERVGQDSRLRLRYVIFGGEALEPASLSPWVARHGDAAPELINMYGITETTVHVTYRRITREEIEAGVRSVIGVPIPDLRIYVLDEALSPVPIGIPGEMYVGGAGVARGYLNRPELTAERFLVDPFDDGSTLYRTGDRAKRLAGGDLEYLGRIDDQVKIRGFRIELGEIEASLERHPLVRHAVVMPWGGAQDKRLVAYVQADADVSPETLREHVREELPEYMVPFAYVLLESFPLTSNGKVDRKSLPEPDIDLAVGRENQVAPRTEIELGLAEIWCELMGLKSVGIQTDFFDVGGHSLLGLTLVTRINERFGVDLEPAVFFENRTIAALALLVQSARRGPDAARPEPGAARAGEPERRADDAPDDAPGAALSDGVRADLAAVEQAIQRARSQGARRSRKAFRMHESWAAKWLLAPLYRLRSRKVRHTLHTLIRRLEGGDAYSVTLRKLFARHFDVHVGDYAMGAFDMDMLKPGTRVGRFSLLTETCRVERANHPLNSLSGHGIFYNRSLRFADAPGPPRNEVEIGNDVFIGHNATILFPTKRIGDGAIVAAHAVVSEDVPPFAVVAGYPARVVRYRFSPAVIERLLRMRWWDAALEDLECVREEFQKPIEGTRIR